LKVEIIGLRLKSKPIVLTQQGLKSGLEPSAKPFVVDRNLRQKS